MASSAWSWVRGLFKRGRTEVTPREQVELRDVFADKASDSAADLAARFTSGSIKLATFQSELYLMTRNATIAQAALAAGGTANLTESVLRAAEKHIGSQLGYLRDFVRSIATGTLTEGQIAARAQMYVASSVQAHERAKAATRSLDLPTYPGETICLSNCRCHWDITEDDENWYAVWRLESSADHCATCLENAGTWGEGSPFTQGKRAA